MILRTPPAKKRAADSAADTSSHPIVIYDFDTASPHSDHHQHPDSSSPFLCTYQCRQMVKSEFFEALSSAEKDARDYKTRFEELKKELSEREAERNMFKERLYISEQNLAAATAHKQALQEQILKEVADSHERYRAVLEHSKQLEVKLKKESDGRKTAEAAAATAAEKVKSLEETLKKVSESAERGKSLLHQELLQLQTESSLSTTRLKADFERMECRASNAEKESELLKNQLEELRLRLNEQKNESKQNLPSHSSSHESSSSDTDILVKHLREELRNYEL